MEDLKGISKDSIFLKNWSYYKLQKKIEDKAKELGIDVVYINPSHTSQRCNKCGCIDKENREDQATFICKTCGFKTLADFNAARNIAMSGIEQIIKDQLKTEKLQRNKKTKKKPESVEAKEIQSSFDLFSVT